MSFETQRQTLGSLLSFILLAIAIPLPFVTSIWLYKNRNRLSNPEFLRRYGGSYENLRLERAHTYLFN